MKTFDAVDLFLIIDLNVVPVSYSGDGLSIFSEMFREEGNVEKTVNYEMISGHLVAMRVNNGAVSGVARVRRMEKDGVR